MHPRRTRCVPPTARSSEARVRGSVLVRAHAVTVADNEARIAKIGVRKRRFRFYKVVPGAGFEPAIHGSTVRSSSSQPVSSAPVPSHPVFENDRLRPNPSCCVPPLHAWSGGKMAAIVKGSVRNVSSAQPPDLVSRTGRPNQYRGGPFCTCVLGLRPGSYQRAPTIPTDLICK
jgi:hypothetical protein